MFSCQAKLSARLLLTGAAVFIRTMFAPNKTNQPNKPAEQQLDAVAVVSGGDDVLTRAKFKARLTDLNLNALAPFRFHPFHR